MPTQRSQSSAPQFHAENEPREGAFHVALHFGLAPVPASAVYEWSGVALCTNHDHSILIGLRLSNIAAHNLFESLREKLISQVLAIEREAGDSASTRLFVGF